MAFLGADTNILAIHRAILIANIFPFFILFFTTLRSFLTITTLRSLAVTTVGDGCRFLNLYWFKNTNQSWMQTSRWSLHAFLTCNRASCLTHDITRHHHRCVSSWVMWLRMLRVTTETALRVFHFLHRFSPEWPIRTLQFNLQCTDNDNKSYRNVCNLSFVLFSLAVIFIIRLSCFLL